MLGQLGIQKIASYSGTFRCFDYTPIYLGDGTLILDLCLAADDGEAAAAASHCREMRGRSTAVRRAMFSPVLCSTASEAVNGFEDGWIRSYTVTVSLSSCPPLLPVHFALKRLSFLPPSALHNFDVCWERKRNGFVSKRKDWRLIPATCRREILNFPARRCYLREHQIKKPVTVETKHHINTTTFIFRFSFVK